MSPVAHECLGRVSRKPRLLVLASTYPRWRDDPEPGFVHALSKRLTDRFDVMVVCPHAPGTPVRETMDGVEVVRYRYAPEKWETLVNDGGIVTNLRRRKWKVFLLPGFILLLAWQAWRQNRKARFDVMHAHWIIPQGLVARVLCFAAGGIPFVVTSHGADLFALRGPVFNWMRRWVMRGAARSTVVSTTMREAVERAGINVDAVSVLPMGIDLKARFQPAESPSQVVDRILFVGRLVEKKGLRFLLQAMPLVLAERPQARLVIAGFGPEEAELKELSRRLGLVDSIEFVGAVAQARLPELYRTASLFVAPFVETASGDQEGLGLVTIEALGCGCPVIVGNVPAVNDVLGAWPECIVDPRDTKLLASRILEVLGHPVVARENALRMRTDLEARLDWSVVAETYGDLLMGVALEGDGYSSRAGTSASEGRQ
ncbi:glycosyltransferase [Pseudoxanthomonas japonensis]|nr:glycosyltransferase [Pseudoxanthomonas japonensis]